MKMDQLILTLIQSLHHQEGGDEHYANLAEFLPDDVLGGISSDLNQNIWTTQCQEKIGKKLIHKV